MPDLGGEDLREGGGVALALADGAETRDGRAGGMDADLAGIEHAEAEDVAVLHRPGADDLGEERHPDPRQGAGLAALERLAAGLLPGPQGRIVHRGQRLVQRGVVVARVVLPAERRGVGEPVLGDEVPPAQLGRVHVELAREHVDHALDEVRRLGDPEGAAVGDTARGLVGVDAVHLDISAGDVVRAGADVEEAGRELRRVRAGVERAVVGEHVASEARDPAVAGRGDLPAHVVVARESGGGEVLHAVLDPLHRPAQHDRGHGGADVAGIHPDLVAEAAADVR